MIEKNFKESITIDTHTHLRLIANNRYELLTDYKVLVDSNEFKIILKDGFRIKFVWSIGSKIDDYLLFAVSYNKNYGYVFTLE